jgi:tetratricopeptide (TPR) repeat protein
MKALKYLRSAYEKQPESEIAAHLAEILWSLGDKEEAKNVFDKAIKKSPDDEYLLKIQHKFLDMHQ